MLGTERAPLRRASIEEVAAAWIVAAFAAALGFVALGLPGGAQPDRVGTQLAGAAAGRAIVPIAALQSEPSG
jgi:hypothetical protein